MAIFRRIITVFTIVVVSVAVVSGAVRLVIHNIDLFKPEIESLLRRHLAPSIAFGGLSGDMIGLNPVIAIDNISLSLPDRSQPLFVDRLTFEMDFWTSLFAGQPVVR